MGKHEGGSIKKVGQNKWQVTVSTGWNPRKGRYDKVKRTVNGTKKDAIKLRDELNRQTAGGVDFELGRQTFREFALDRLAKRKRSGELAPGTLHIEASRLNVLFGYIGDTELRKLTAKTLSDVLDAAHAERGWNGTTWAEYFGFLKAILGDAERLGAIDRNPMNRLSRPHASKPDRRALNAEELRRLMRELDRCENAAADRGTPAAFVKRAKLVGVRIIAYTGMRRGEVLGLQWRDLDAERRTVSVNRQMTQKDGITAPKTLSSTRTVTIPRALVQSLELWRFAQQVAAESAGIVEPGGELPETVPIVCSGAFSHTSNITYGDWWRSWADAHGFPGLRLHELRHSVASVLVADGIDVASVADRLGHSDATTTLRIYTHPTAEGARAAADDMERVLS